MLSNQRLCDEELDALALLACQDYNLGNHGNWFFSFRSGFSGFHSRMLSLEEHRRLVYEWHPGAQINGHERHIAIILFAMDSAFECLIFALNALGQAYLPHGFRQTTDDASLRKISPRDILGTRSSGPLSGWLTLFSEFQHHCLIHSDLLAIVMENHDVTKHRQSGFHGGKTRSDPPEGFFERLGISGEDPRRIVIAPMEEVLIPLSPKMPMDERSSDLRDWAKLENVIENFRFFINECVSLANRDAQKNLQIPVSVLRTR